MESNATFCPNCGKKVSTSKQISEREDSTPSEIRNSTVKLNSNKRKSYTPIIVGLIIAFIVVITFIKIQYNPNNRSAKDTADIVQTIAEKDFGKGQVQVYYSKGSNEFSIKPKKNSDVEKTLEENIEYGDSQSDTEDIIDNFKDLIKDIHPKMGSKYKSYETLLLNPDNTDRYLMEATGKKVNTNYLPMTNDDDDY